MNLLETFDSLLQQWRGVFSQERTFERARRLTFGLLSCLRMHLTSTAICASGRQFQDWSADYRVCSRSPWEPRQLFDVVLDHLVRREIRSRISSKSPMVLLLEYPRFWMLKKAGFSTQS